MARPPFTPRPLSPLSFPNPCMDHMLPYGPGNWWNALF